MAEEVHRGPLPKGFVWGALAAGIKASGKSDVAIAVATSGSNAAAMFTRNQVVAAPVTVGRRHLTSTGGRVSAVVVNAGNANCATGEEGIRAAVDTCRTAAETFGCVFDEVFPSSTGIIGVPLPLEKLVRALAAAPELLGDSPEHADAFAEAILTTDTHLKTSRAVIDVDGTAVHLFGCAKGAGMIAPRLGATAGPAPKHATMLVYLFTDLAASAPALQAMLDPAVETSFNRISIDGDTSTNDTVLLLASGGSQIRLDDRVRTSFEGALKLVCGSLAHQIVDDGEGVTHVVNLHISGCPSEADALQVARSIANSPLNKTAWSSADPNWGRLLAAAGYSGVHFDPARVRISIGEQIVFESGRRADLFDKAAAHRTMSQREYSITVDLGEGEASCSFLTSDLTEEYVRINADYST